MDSEECLLEGSLAKVWGESPAAGVLGKTFGAGKSLTEESGVFSDGEGTVSRREGGRKGRKGLLKQGLGPMRGNCGHTQRESKSISVEGRKDLNALEDITGTVL